MPDICPTLHYDDARAAMRFLVEAFGFTERTVVPGAGDAVAHAQLAWGDGVVFLSSRDGTDLRATGPACTHVVVEDPDAHHARAVAHGAEIVQDLQDAGHGRGYVARDPEGNLWAFNTYRP